MQAEKKHLLLLLLSQNTYLFCLSYSHLLCVFPIIYFECLLQTKILQNGGNCPEPYLRARAVSLLQFHWCRYHLGVYLFIICLIKAASLLLYEVVLERRDKTMTSTQLISFPVSSNH